MKIYIINGPNLNMLGIREPAHYGSMSYDGLVKMLTEYADARGVETVIYQSNHEGDLVDMIQEAYFAGAYGIVINPGAYTHTSIALLDAVKATSLPTVEVHISKVEEREAYRQVSYVREAAVKTVTGHGTDGYIEAIDFLIERSKNES
ncbi:MAG: 3-dehydroquinate dehydratase [Clostridia bacterium]|nr:3-dehydroquinate dehydratase [Clostridia bacterium]